MEKEDIYSNKPSGKSSQTFYFTQFYEAKHAIGKEYSKFHEFESRPSDHFVLVTASLLSLNSSGNYSYQN